MPPRVKNFSLPKAGNSVDEYEDAKNYKKGEGIEYRYAIADGATETSFSGLWARLLTAAYVNRQLTEISAATIEPLSAKWNRQVEKLVEQKSLPWYVEEKISQGAFSSVLGLEIKADGSWNAICVGDSCLFQIRKGQLIVAFPLKTPDEFNNRPILISTRLSQNQDCEQVETQGHWKAGDCFFLMTDSIACYFLKRINKELVRKLRGMKTREEFEIFVNEARQLDMRNDDVTLLRIRLENDK